MRCALPLPFRRAKLSGRRLLPWGETASGAAAGLRRSGFHPVAVPEQVRGRVALGPVHAPQDWGRALDRTGPAVDRAAVGLAELPAAVGLAAQPAVVELAALPAAGFAAAAGFAEPVVVGPAAGLVGPAAP